MVQYQEVFFPLQMLFHEKIWPTSVVRYGWHFRHVGRYWSPAHSAINSPLATTTIICKTLHALSSKAHCDYLMARPSQLLFLPERQVLYFQKTSYEGWFLYITFCLNISHQENWKYKNFKSTKTLEKCLQFSFSKL